MPLNALPHRRSFLQRCGAGLAAAALPVPSAGRASPPGPVELVIDASAPAGTIRPLHGVNGGPLAQGGTLDLSARFREFAPPLVRLHDCRWPNPDVVDLHAIFPDPAADPEKPGSYDFARTDEYVRAVLDTGVGIVFRLGESIEHVKAKRRVRPPRDPDRWAAACVGVVRHYTDGWADGFRYPIRYWEVWNEPDNRPNMWTGTDEDYFRLYSVTVKAIKTRFPKLLVGGPGLGNTGTLSGDRLDPPPFPTRFLAHCKRDAAPLDFFSWHCYAGDPTEFVRRAKEVRRVLTAAGFPPAESHLNEWNYLPDGDWGPMMSADATARQRWYERGGGPEGAAFVAATLLLLQDAPVDAANFFCAEPQGMGLFNCYGVPKATFRAFQAFRGLVDAPARLPVTGLPVAGLPAGLAGAAGLSRDRSAVVVLLSRFAGAAGRVAVTARNLPWAGPTEHETLRIDAGNDFTRPVSGRINQDGRVAVDLAAPAVALVRLRPARGG